MTSTTKWIGIGLMALTLGGAVIAQGQERRTRGERSGARAGILRLLQTLEATDAQRAEALEAARAAEPIARAARAAAARIRIEALEKHPGDRRAAREEMRERVQELRRTTLAELAPHAQRVLSTLTSEQRAKLADAAAARGRTLDEARLVRITSFLLTRPATVARLEAKLGR